MSNARQASAATNRTTQTNGMFRARRFVRAARAGFIATCASSAVLAAELRTEPPLPQAHTPYAVVVRFDVPVCTDGERPAAVTIDPARRSVELLLSHVVSTRCDREHRLPGPPLPEGLWSFQVGVTRGEGIGIARTTATDPTLQARSSVRVEAQPNLRVRAAWTQRVNFRQLFVGTSPLPPIVPYPFDPAGGAILTHDGWTLGTWIAEIETVEPDGQHAFRFVERLADDPLPGDFVPIYRVYYPDPWRGVYLTTRAEEANALVQAWYPPGHPRAQWSAAPWGYVLRMSAGVCPAGASAVLQAFNPARVSHRYTKSADTYAQLIQSGWIGEGPRFCSID